MIETGAEPGHPEFSWVGRRMRAGAVEIEIIDTCPRCVMVTREISAALPADREVLRHIVRELEQDVGVYARVTGAGTVGVADVVTFAD